MSRLRDAEQDRISFGDGEVIKTAACRRALHHKRRAHAFRRCERGAQFAVVASGVAILAGVPHFIAGGAVLLSIGLTLVFRFDELVEDHSWAQSAYLKLATDIELAFEPDDGQRAEWRTRLLDIRLGDAR